MSFGTALSVPDLHRVTEKQDFSENVPKLGSVQMVMTTQMKGSDG